MFNSGCITLDALQHSQFLLALPPHLPCEPLSAQHKYTDASCIPQSISPSHAQHWMLCSILKCWLSDSRRMGCDSMHVGESRSQKNLENQELKHTLASSLFHTHNETQDNVNIIGIFTMIEIDTSQTWLHEKTKVMSREQLRVRVARL
jgi:hypothetical protein